jgi:RNA polymerase sigma-70 factor, ECF subfamily
MAEPRGDRLQQQSASDQSWNTLLCRIAQRDTDAFAAVYDGTSSIVYTVALRILGNTADADEVTIDVYAYVWESAASYDSTRGTVTTWLIMLARSRAIERLRKRAATKNGNGNQIHTLEGLRNDFGACNGSMAHHDRAILVGNVLRQLSSADQEVITLAFFSGLSHSELASQLNLPLGTVKSRLRAILLRLRNLLE